MISKKFTIKNEQGLHMRPAGVLTAAMMKFDCDVNLVSNGTTFSAKSIMNVMAACIKNGMEIEVICDGTDEEQAMETFASLVESGFGE